ncbi:dihydroorotase [Psychromonas sp. CNPT3]|uniref:dihydroorotase n=1 Tax=Psychromonas sp. CNPT3 TaxID=314282 RepID=UPI00006E85D2|nr:dihydroorotase [Psychromonas sp. CNPT3]AGH81423.1 dihydroorotase [Psychromonas sp. CNPT3]
MITLSLTRPDDWHLHLRDGDVLKDTVEDSSRYMGRAIIMPNTVPPISTTDLAKAYKERIMAALPSAPFQPLMTLYLTDNTTPEEIRKAKVSGFIYAAKLYPAGATTNSDSGVSSTDKIKDVLETMQKLSMPLLVHGEVTAHDVDIFDREGEFLERVLRPLISDYPQLKIVVEHITTEDAVRFVSNAGPNIAATITPHHLLFERNDMLVGGIKPHFYCLPILKRKRHQQALITAATSGSPKFFLGTDSAPHTKQTKESACGCAGSYSAFAAIELYAEVFEKAGALEKLEAFASFHGPDFYGLERNSDTITLQKKEWQVPETLEFGNDKVVPVKAGEMLAWQVVS